MAHARLFTATVILVGGSSAILGACAGRPQVFGLADRILDRIPHALVHGTATNPLLTRDQISVVTRTELNDRKREFVNPTAAELIV